MHVVILSGGVGSRLWPISREGHPKPFIKLQDNDSILQKTLHRALRISEIKSLTSVSNIALKFKLNDEQNKILGKHTCDCHYILEPFAKNTAAAIAISTLYIKEQYGPNALIITMPSDHIMTKEDNFLKAVDLAKKLAEKGQIVTFGCTPIAAETGYGYIHAEGTKVLEFVEKPDHETAVKYLASGNYLWNLGVFCFKANVMLEQMQLYCDDILEVARLTLESSEPNANGTYKELQIDPHNFAKARDESIDYAVMEKSKCISVIQSDLGWSDIGSWDQLSKLNILDVNNNSTKGEVVLEGVSNSHIESEGRLIAAIGIDNLVVVDTSDALLIADKSKVQSVKQVYNKLRLEGHQSTIMHKTVFRPWGSYSIINEGKNFKVKRIEVNPGASLSLQKHKHRAEHWVVVSGVATVINEHETLTLNISESTYIPAGNKHRLSNPSDKMLIIIEVQTGGYLGEDDIIRFDDIYGR